VVRDVSIRFNFHKERIDNIKEYFIKFLKGKLHFEEFWALSDISFTLEKGSSLGFVGRNGSGKSTMLKILAGVMKATRGSVKVNGSIAPLIELGAGFDPELTARENIYLNSAVLGYSRQETKENFDKIVAFSELEEFMDVPVKNFSSGMYARLGFSIATFGSPDILIVDEILSVGDFKFQEKCEARIREMLLGNTTLLFVSHSVEQVMNLCDKALWFDHGRIKMLGEAQEVCEAYAKS
jgi:ABC-2 type transport system ATP-binding protein/lipopolysaccharide transport system ATP-binding protein